MPVVSDASPLILFAKIGRLDLLKRLIDNMVFMVFVNFWYENSFLFCLLYTSPSPRDRQKSRMPSSA